MFARPATEHPFGAAPPKETTASNVRLFCDDAIAPPSSLFDSDEPFAIPDFGPRASADGNHSSRQVQARFFVPAPIVAPVAPAPPPTAPPTAGASEGGIYGGGTAFVLNKLVADIEKLMGQHVVKLERIVRSQREMHDECLQKFFDSAPGNPWASQRGPTKSQPTRPKGRVSLSKDKPVIKMGEDGSIEIGSMVMLPEDSTRSRCADTRTDPAVISVVPFVENCGSGDKTPKSNGNNTDSGDQSVKNCGAGDETPKSNSNKTDSGEQGEAVTGSRSDGSTRPPPNLLDIISWKPHGRSSGRPRHLEVADEEWVDGESCVGFGFRRYVRFVLSPRFDYMIGVVIILNTIFIGFQIDYNSRELQNSSSYDEPGFITGVETIFASLFTIEWLSRLVAFRERFPYSMWNLFDTVVVVTAVFEEVIKYAVKSDTIVGQFSVLRVVRVLKLVRTLRIIRVVRAFRELRIVLTSILICMRELFWTLFLLFVLLYMVSVLVLGELTQVPNPFGDGKFGEFRQMYFGNLPRTLFTIFQATTFGMPWEVMSTGLEDVMPWVCIVWILYMALWYLPSAIQLLASSWIKR
jgi:voltage-gated sodium channel